MAYETLSLTVCDSCMQFLANGELPYDSEKRNNKFIARITRNWPPGETAEGQGKERVYYGEWQLVPSCSHPGCPETKEGWKYCEASFSFAECDSCGEGKGGHRHHATAMREVRTHLQQLGLIKKKEQS